jgi:hypothetical protein
VELIDTLAKVAVWLDAEWQQDTSDHRENLNQFWRLQILHAIWVVLLRLSANLGISGFFRSPRLLTPQE